MITTQFYTLCGILEKVLRLLQWRHSERDDVSNHQPHVYLLNRLFRRSSKKTSKLRVTGLCEWPVISKENMINGACIRFKTV